MGRNQDPGSGINIPDPQHCRESPNWIAGPRWGGGGGKLGSSRGRSEGAELEGENKRGGRVEGLKPMCEGDGGWVSSVVRKFYWAEKFSYRTANTPPIILILTHRFRPLHPFILPL